MYAFLLVVNVICALVMVGVILLQHGQGAEMGSSFGRGSQGSLFGVTGSANFLSRLTALLAILFFSTALSLSLVPQGGKSDAVLESLSAPVAEQEAIATEVPVVPASEEQ